MYWRDHAGNWKHWDGDTEPTEEVIQEYWLIDKMEDHLAIRHKCPCCGGKRTRWLEREWNICYDCRIAFTMADLEPVNTPDVVSDYQAKMMKSYLEDNEASHWEQIAYELGK